MKLEDYISHLESRGYAVNGNEVFLGNNRYVICEGYDDTPWGKRKTYWLEISR